MIVVCNQCVEGDVKRTMAGRELKKKSMFYYKKSSSGGFCARCGVWYKTDKQEFHNFEAYDDLLKKGLVKQALLDLSER